MNVRIIEVLACVVGKLYVGILVYRVHRVTGGLIDDEQGGLRAGRGCVDVGDKLLVGINSLYVDSLACVRKKGGENEWLRIDSRERQG